MALQFRAGAVLTSSDGVNQTEIEIPETEQEAAARRERDRRLGVGEHGYKSLADQLADKKEREEEEWKERHRHLPTAPLDEQDVEFLEVKKREAFLLERKRKQMEASDRAEYELAIAAARVKTHSEATSETEAKKNNEDIQKKENKLSHAFEPVTSVKAILAAKRVKQEALNQKQDIKSGKGSQDKEEDAKEKMKKEKKDKKEKKEKKEKHSKNDIKGEDNTRDSAINYSQSSSKTQNKSSPINPVSLQMSLAAYDEESDEDE